MEQLRLFPPPGAIKEPLPNDALSEARELLAELLSEVIDPTREQQPSREESADE